MGGQLRKRYYEKGIRSSSRLGYVIARDINTDRHRIVSDAHPNALRKPNSSVNEELPRRPAISNLLYFLRKYPNQSFPSFDIALTACLQCGSNKKHGAECCLNRFVCWLERRVELTPELLWRDYTCRAERCLHFHKLDYE